VNDKAGVSLIEIMFAVVILGTVLIALGGLMAQAARFTRQAATAGYQSAAATSAAAWIQMLPWDSIDAGIGCVDRTVGQLEYSRCMSVQDIGTKQKRVSVIISATGVLTAQPETVVVERHKPISPSTLNIR
jgi:hypothetical protein